METAPLKSFATWARTALIREVTARIAVVLAPASPERVEQPKAVEALEKAVSAAGGGDKGKAAVADKVAYTWFNRIIALRFMDANGYTGVGVASPQAGVETGQPEILAEAKRGNIDAAVVGGKTRDTVTALLNGTRRSDDAQGEAYALLLADYCRYWNRAMPFMFEREGDFTELLIPANLLADDSVPSRAIKVLTTDVCQDVEVIGWLYQFYISERKDEVFAGFKKNKKAGADEIPAATQLFTPHWIVRYLVENSLGRLWMLNRPSSRLVDQMPYYVAPIDQETDFLKVSSPETLKVVDPACGSGHMLTYAFDLLYAIYEEEGYAPAEIPGHILTSNLYGVEIDPRAGALAAFALTMKARAKQRKFFNKKVEPNVCVLDPIHFTPEEIDFLLTRGGDRHSEAAFWNQFEHADTTGALIQPDPELTTHLKQHLVQLDDSGDLLLAEVLDSARRVLLQARYLTPVYSVVVANPPYMGWKNMSEGLSTWVGAQYAIGKQDLYGAFIMRARKLVQRRGIVAMITGDSWMTIKTFEQLRAELLKNCAVPSVLHLQDSSRHADTFGANVAFVLEEGRSTGRRARFVYLESLSAESKGAQFLQAIRTPSVPWAFEVETDHFEDVPGAPFAYRISDDTRRAFRNNAALGAVATPLQGLATADDGRFLRRWWEVSRGRLETTAKSRDDSEASGARWFPFTKGGDYRRWYGNNEFVVNWECDGKELLAFRPRSVIRNPSTYFRESITWGLITAGEASFRYEPPGRVFGHKGPVIVAENSRTLLAMLAYANSSSATHFLRILSPTLGYEVGHVASLPVPSPDDVSIEACEALLDISKADWDSSELSWNFSRLAVLRRGPLSEIVDGAYSSGLASATRVQELERVNDKSVAAALGVSIPPRATDIGRIPLHANPRHGMAANSADAEVRARFARKVVAELVSFAVGCMFGRFSLDSPGLVIQNQGDTIDDYVAQIPRPSFAADNDGVIPIVDGDWFEDDIVARFRTFLRVAFGEQHFEQNLRFVTEALGIKDIREYFVRTGTRAASSKFYDDHVQRYKKRPIYWLFSSPKGSFNALIYMHRYTPSTVSTVLNEYLREFRAKLSSSLQQHERLAAGGGTPRQQAAAQKEADRLRTVLLELAEYEHDVLYPLASRQLAIDLDDGVKANYPKFGAALKTIPGLEASDE